MLQGIDRVLNRTGRLKRDIKHVERPMKAAGTYMVGSIVRNFNSSGRPKKWEKLADGTVAARRRGKKKGGLKILIDKGDLRNSHSIRLRQDGVEVGTNKVQAKRQHLGYPEGTGRGHAKTPARPFVMFQDDDPEAIGKIFNQHFSR